MCDNGHKFFSFQGEAQAFDAWPLFFVRLLLWRLLGLLLQAGMAQACLHDGSSAVHLCGSRKSEDNLSLALAACADLRHGVTRFRRQIQQRRVTTVRPSTVLVRSTASGLIVWHVWHRPSRGFRVALMAAGPGSCAGPSPDLRGPRDTPAPPASDHTARPGSARPDRVA